MAHLDPLELLTISQVAQLSKRHRSTLYRDIREGHLKIVRLGRSIRVPRGEVERYLIGDTFRDAGDEAEE